MATTGAPTPPEIAEAPSVSAPKIESLEPDLYRNTRPGLKRFALTLTVLFSFLLGLPFLLKSVEIYRSPLPFREIDNLSAAVESNPLHFPCKFRAVFVGTGGSSFIANELSGKIEYHMREIAAKDSASCGACSYNLPVSVVVENGADCFRNDNDFSWKCGELDKYENLREFDDESFDEYLHTLLDDNGSRSSGGKVYTVIVLRREKHEDVSAVVGKYRHGWIVGKVSEEEAVKKVAEVFVKAFVNGGKEEGSISGEFMPVGADGKIVLSFSLLNAEPRDWTYDWEFQEIDDNLLAPIRIENIGSCFVKRVVDDMIIGIKEFQEIDDNLLAPILKSLMPLAEISVESQVLYHTPKSSFSYWDEKLGSYIFTTKDLPFFVNSNEWHLDTTVATGGRSKILHHVVYVPSSTECPLLLKLPSGEISKSNGFISPMWGSVVVWNPPGCLNDSKMDTHVRHKISSEELRSIFEVFIGQLRQLFGLKSKGLFRDASGSLRLLTSESGFTEWELDVLSRQHTCFNLHECTTTLGSLSRLVQSLPRMIIKEEIGEQVRYSLEAAKMALSNVSHGVYDAAAVSSRRGRSFAEDAFYHPSMMSVSYYSFEHCFAVYSPFFLPVSLHVLLAALREWKRYKQESRKFSAFKAKKD